MKTLTMQYNNYQQSITPVQTYIMKKPQPQDLKTSLTQISQKLSLINFQNIEPPFLLRTLSELRRSHLQPHLRPIALALASGTDLEIERSLSDMNFIIDTLDEGAFERYAQLLVMPYVNKMRREDWEIDGVSFRDIQRKYNLSILLVIVESQVNESLFWAVKWFIELEKMQDLFSRVELYFGIEVPNFMADLQKKLSKCIDEKSDTKRFLTKAKRMLSSSLKKTSQLISSPIFTGIVSSALILTIALLENTTIPLQQKLNLKFFIPAGLVAFTPSILDSLAFILDKSDTNESIRKWEATFVQLSGSLMKFNSCVEKAIKLCFGVKNKEGYLRERTNLEKLINSLNIDIEFATDFDELKFQDMRMRTEAYFKEYMEIVEGEWTLVLTKEEANQRKIVEKEEEEFQLLKLSTELNGKKGKEKQKGEQKQNGEQKVKSLQQAKDPEQKAKLLDSPPS